MTREEYRQLEALARRQPTSNAPVPVVLANADYRASIDAGMATVEGRLTVEVLARGLHKLPLHLGGVWLRKATLDDTNAAIGRSADGQVVLLVRGIGQHLLALELQAPVAIEAARQSLNCLLPHGGSTSLMLNVPGNVTIKSGAQAASRRFDRAANRTRFELLCKRGPLALVMSLNNRRLRHDRVVVARSVLVAELTTTYERLHATISFDVLHAFRSTCCMGPSTNCFWMCPLGSNRSLKRTKRVKYWALRDAVITGARIDGKNVRGWDVTRQAAESRLTIELLKPVKGHEQIAVHLSRRTPLVAPQSTAINTPIVTVPGAALHRGVVWIRRSPILELKTTVSSGVVRTDASAVAKTLASAASGAPSPLGVQPYQAFRFRATPFRIAVVATRIEPHLAARLRTVLRIGETKSDLESEIGITSQRRPVHDLHLKIPADLDLKQVTAAGLGDWSISKDGAMRVLNAGRDEVVVDDLKGFAPVNRQSRQWQFLATRLGSDNFATAYVNNTVGADAQFGYKTRRREIIETAGATIGLARTTLVLDGSGAYRGTMLMKVDNRTEPYLEIQLPATASLWTAHVADQPVKPARSAAAKDGHQLRIPLVKTAEGDLDYSIVLKYGGAFDHFALFRTVRFPIIRTVNIHVEQSQIKLVLPTTHNWYRFDGTATQVGGGDDFVAGYVAYRTHQVESLTEVLRGSNYFSQMRASGNISNLQAEIGQEIEQLKRATGGRRSSSAKLRDNLDLNQRAFQDAAKQVQQLNQSASREADNRKRLGTFYKEQRNTLSKNSVIKLRANFAAPSPPSSAASRAAHTNGSFNARWLSGSGLAGSEPSKKASIVEQSDARKRGGKGRRIRGQLGRRSTQEANAPSDRDAAQNVFGYKLHAAGKAKPQRAGARGRARQGDTQRELGVAYAEKIRNRATQKREVAQQQADGKQSVAAGVEAATRAAAAGRPPAPTAGAVPPTGLVSLDVEFPERGTAYYFTTPRGAVEITARPVDRRLVDRAANFVWLLVIAAALGMVFYVTRRLAHARGLQVLAAVAIGGVGLLLAWIVPIMGLVMLLGSILIAVRQPVAA